MKGDDVVERTVRTCALGPIRILRRNEFNETMRHVLHDALLDNLSVFTGPTKLPKC
jgi:hypothetical protein